MRLAEADDAPDVSRLAAPVVVIFFMWGFGTGALWVARPLFADSLGASLFQIGLVSSFSAMPRLLSGPVTGLLSDRWGRRPMLLLGAAAHGAILVAQFFSDDYAQFALLELLAGVGIAFWTVSSGILIADLTRVANRGRGVGLRDTAMRLGMLAGPLAGGLIAAQFELRWVFIFIASTKIPAIFVVLFIIPETRPRIVRQILQPRNDGGHHLRRLEPERLRAAVDLRPSPVFRSERFRRNVARMARADGLRRLSRREVERAQVRLKRHLHIQHAHVHAPPDARPRPLVQRRENAKRKSPPSADIPHRKPHIHRIVPRIAGDAHRAAERLHDAVERRAFRVWAVLPEAGERRGYDRRVDRAQSLVVYPQALQHAGAEVVQNDVRFRRERVERLDPCVRAQVKRDASLVAVEPQKVRALAAEEVRPQFARGVAGAGLLDLDDVRA